MSGRPITSAEVEYVYANSTRMSQRAICKALGRQQQTIARIQNSLGLDRFRKPQRFLSRGEVAFIRANSMTMTRTEIAAHLSRAYSTIEKAQKRLKLKCARAYLGDPPSWLPSELAPAYRKKVSHSGQYYAAAWARRQKAKMEAVAL